MSMSAMWFNKPQENPKNPVHIFPSILPGSTQSQKNHSLARDTYSSNHTVEFKVI